MTMFNLNRYLSLFALVFVLVLICLTPMSASAQFSPVCLHGCNDLPEHMDNIPGPEYKAVQAWTWMWCDDVHPPTPYCSPIELSSLAVATVIINDCPSQWGPFIASVDEQAGSGQIYSKTMVGLASAPGVVLAHAYIIKDYWGETIEGDTYVSPNYTFCLSASINIED